MERHDDRNHAGRIPVPGGPIGRIDRFARPCRHRTAALPDHADWSLLIGLARNAGHHDVAASCATALEQEETHLRSAQIWREHAVLGEAKGIRPLGQHDRGPHGRAGTPGRAGAS